MREGEWEIIETFFKRDKKGNQRIYHRIKNEAGVVKEAPKDSCDKLIKKYGYIKRVQSMIKKGYGDISGPYFSAFLRAAKARSKEVQVTIEDLWDGLVAQKFRCALTGWPITMVPVGGRHMKTQAKELISASPDRIDSFIGYLPWNLQWLDKMINHLKNSYTTKELLVAVIGIYRHMEGTAIFKEAEIEADRRMQSDGCKSPSVKPA